MSNVEELLIRARTPFDRINDRQQLVQWAEESQFARQAVEGSAKLQGCTADSVMNAIINVAATGLTLNPALGYAYLVPEFNKSTERDECQLRVSFKGLIKVATDSRAIEWVAADVVKEADFFRFNGKWEKPDHNMDNPFSEDRGKSIGVYCCVKLSTGDYITEIAPWEQVLKAKAAAKYSGVWDKWPDEMAKKFIIKRASKQWPHTDQTDRLAQTVGVVNQYEGSDALIDKMDNVAGVMLQALHHEEGPQEDVIIECWEELTDEEKTTLNTAYSKGGYFQHTERYAIRDIISNWHREQRESKDADESAAL